MLFAVEKMRHSNCCRRKVGAVITSKTGYFITSGFNGTPDCVYPTCNDGGCERCKSKSFKPGKSYDLCICVHAEQNALMDAAYWGVPVRGGTIYTTLQPCLSCLKMLLQAGIITIYYHTSWLPTVALDEEDAILIKHYKMLSSHINMIQISSFK